MCRYGTLGEIHKETKRQPLSTEEFGDRSFDCLVFLFLQASSPHGLINRFFCKTAIQLFNYNRINVIPESSSNSTQKRTYQLHYSSSATCTMYREKYNSKSSRKAQLHVLCKEKSMNQCHLVKLNYMYCVQRGVQINVIPSSSTTCTAYSVQLSAQVS